MEAVDWMGLLMTGQGQGMDVVGLGGGAEGWRIQQWWGRIL